MGRDLMRRPPRTSSGDPLPRGADMAATITAALLDLDSSYVAVHGPPGLRGGFARDLELLTRPNDAPLFQPILATDDVHPDAVALGDTDQGVASLHHMDSERLAGRTRFTRGQLTR